MQQSACDPVALGSSDLINKWERIGPKQRLNGFCQPLKPTPGTQGQAAGAMQGDSSHFSFPNQPPNVRCQLVSRVAIAILGLDVPRVPTHPVADDAAGACRLIFVAKPPSSG